MASDEDPVEEDPAQDTELVEKGATNALERHAPTPVRIDNSTTTPFLLKQRVQRLAPRPLVPRKLGMGDTWWPLNTRGFYERVQQVAAGLITRGLVPDQKVAIMGRIHYKQTLPGFVSWNAGLTPAPIYETSSVGRATHVPSDAEVDLVTTKAVLMAEVVRTAAERNGRRRVAVLSPDPEATETFITEGMGIPRTQATAHTDVLRKDDIATIVCTSGATGTPKGIVLTHENFTNLCPNAHTWMPEIAAGKDSRLLLFLPLAYVSARLLQVFQISGSRILAHVPNTKNLLPDLTSFKLSYLLVVPRVSEKIYNPADVKASKGARETIFRWAAHVTTEYLKALDTTEGLSCSLRVQHVLTDGLVYQSTVKLAGGNARYIVPGGALLMTWLGHLYRELGIPVSEGYDLAEAVRSVPANAPSLSKTGTVGPALPPMSSKISDEGEILLKGSSVFHGYNNDSEASAACFTEDGWSKAGDLGSLDRDGYVQITEYAREIIVTAGGKNAAPALLEDPMRSHPLIPQVLAVGDQRPFVSAITTLDAEMLPVWLESYGLPPMSAADTRTNVEVLASLQEAADSTNAHVSRVGSIRKFMVLASDFTKTNGILTPSLKVKRDKVVLCLTPIIDELYDGSVQT